jgi:hypothetical protein
MMSFWNHGNSQINEHGAISPVWLFISCRLNILGCLYGLDYDGIWKKGTTPEHGREERETELTTITHN